MDTKNIVERIIRKHQTNSPFAIAKNLGIIILYSDMKNTLGFFSKYRRSKFIHLNSNLPETLKNFVCAHELGHAIQHPHLNTPFLKAHTLFSTDKIERQANTFAVELLMPDSLIREYSNLTLPQFAVMQNVPEKLLCLKMFKNNNSSFY